MGEYRRRLKKFYEEREIENKTVQTQSKSYKIIETNTKMQNRYQRKVLDTVRRYQFENEFLFKKVVEEKGKQFNMVEFQLSNIKSETSFLEKKLENILNDQLEVGKLITKINDKIDGLNFTNEYLIKDYKVELFKLINIHHTLKVDEVDDIILIFKNKSLQFETDITNVKLY